MNTAGTRIEIQFRVVKRAGGKNGSHVRSGVLEINARIALITYE